MAWQRLKVQQPVSPRVPDEKSQLTWLQREVHLLLGQLRTVVNWSVDWLGLSGVDATDEPGTLEDKILGTTGRLTVTKTGTDGDRTLTLDVDAALTVAETVAATYDAGSTAAHQTMTLTDAKGGPLELDGNDAGFTGKILLKLDGKTQDVLVREDGALLEFSNGKIAIGMWELAPPGTITTASGADSIAIGTSAVASGADSISQGQDSAATEANAVAIGKGAHCYGGSSVAIGNGANVAASQTNSVAIGSEASVATWYSIGIGYRASVAASSGGVVVGSEAGISSTGDYSVVVGNSSSATQNYATAVGPNADVSGSGGVALGHDTDATGNYAVAIGKLAQAGANEVVFVSSTSPCHTFRVHSDRTADYKLFEFKDMCGVGQASLSLLVRTGASSWEYKNLTDLIGATTPMAHAASHTNGTDQVANVTSSASGLARKPQYGEMYEYDNASTLAIDTTDTYHALFNASLTGGDLNGWTFSAGTSGTFTAVADLGVVGGVNQVRFTTGAAHTLVAGQTVNLTSSSVAGYLTQTADANHEDCFYVIKNVSDNTHFDVVSADLGTATGNWRKGAALVAGADAAGEYELSWGCTFLPAAANKLYKFEPRINVTAVDKAVAETKPSAADPRAIKASCYVTIAAGDRVIMTCKNKTDTSNVTIVHSNIHVKRLY